MVENEEQISVDLFPFELNRIAPCFNNKEDDPDFGRVFLAYGRYRLGTPYFDSLESASDWCYSNILLLSQEISSVMCEIVYTDILKYIDDEKEKRV